MNAEKSVGRVVGVLIFLQMAMALTVPFIMMDALLKGYPAFLDTAAANGAKIRAGVLFAFLGLGLTLAIGTWLYPVLKPHSRRAALWFLAICTISAALDAVHNGTVLSMLTVGEKFVGAGAAESGLNQAWGAVAASMRRSAHIVQLFAIGAWMATFYILLWRFRLVPRALSALGLAGVAGQFAGVTLMMFLGYSPISYLAMPLAPIHAATAVWLIVKGFPPPNKPAPTAEEELA
jgi:hypothetical protein